MNFVEITSLSSRPTPLREQLLVILPKVSVSCRCTPAEQEP
jgi:hypothetical protein